MATIDYVLMVISLVVAMMGIALAWVMYVRRPNDLPLIVGRGSGRFTGWSTTSSISTSSMPPLWFG